jgi:hypothetical protein
VPIEIGPTLIGKQAMRFFLGLKKIGDYHWFERYPLSGLLRMVFAGERTEMERPVYSAGDHRWHSHYGFNGRALKSRVAETFVIEREHFTPLAWSRGIVSSQVWFVCRPK